LPGAENLRRPATLKASELLRTRCDGSTGLTVDETECVSGRHRVVSPGAISLQAALDRDIEGRVG
jgi:hypothetical protein